MLGLTLTLLLLALPAGDDVPNPRRGEDPFAPSGYGLFGGGLAVLGDLDGDGKPEFSVSDAGTCVPPTVWILSGADAHVVDRISDDDCDRHFGGSVARIPDLDRDGVDDIAILSTPDWRSCARARVALFSGRTRKRVGTLECPPNIDEFGSLVTGLPDVDGDGCGDVLVGASGKDAVRCGFVFSGANGMLLFELWAPPELRMPEVAPVCDFDGDGRAELAISGTDEWTTRPAAIVCSGRDGHALGKLSGTTRNERFGVRALMLDERVPELLLLSDGLVEPAAPAPWTPRIQVRHPLQNDEAVYGCGSGVVGDVDGDGLPDFVVVDCDGIFCTGSATCYSGRTGKALWHEPPWPSWRNVELHHLGHEFAVIGDYDRDGVRDFIWATDNCEIGSPGLVFISSGKTGRALKVLARGPKLEILRLGPTE